MGDRVGMRVGAILGEKDGVVRFFGYGTYLGDFPRPGSGPPWSSGEYELAKKTILDHDEHPLNIDYTEYYQNCLEGGYYESWFDVETVHHYARTSHALDEFDLSLEEKIDRLLHAISLNPKIELDSGEIVWGMECWWGSEDKIRAQLEGKNVEMVSINELRAQGQRSIFA